MREDKQAVCTAMCEALRKTVAAGSGNQLVEIRYIKRPDGSEIARPIFWDGCGENGYYDVNITCDSGIAIIMDITDKFVKKVW